MKLTTKLSIIRSTFTAALAAVLCALSLISLPAAGGRSVSLQHMGAVFAGLLAGGAQGAGSVGIFLLAGMFGLPVFPGRTGGMEALLAATGGFTAGYFLSALAAGLCAGSPRLQERRFSAVQWLRTAAGAVLGFAASWLPGICWYIRCMEAEGRAVSAAAAWQEQVLPSLPGEIPLLIAAVPLAAVLRPAAARLLYPDDDKEADELLASLSKKRKG
ncbi:MAG: biotin transporter BioY [Treponema sp.]|nr:biotin transporter BioY [Treponema sp.]